MNVHAASFVRSHLEGSTGRPARTIRDMQRARADLDPQRAIFFGAALRLECGARVGLGMRGGGRKRERERERERERDRDHEKQLKKDCSA